MPSTRSSGKWPRLQSRQYRWIRAIETGPRRVTIVRDLRQCRAIVRPQRPHIGAGNWLSGSSRIAFNAAAPLACEPSRIARSMLSRSGTGRPASAASVSSRSTNLPCGQQQSLHRRHPVAALWQLTRADVAPAHLAILKPVFGETTLMFAEHRRKPRGLDFGQTPQICNSVRMPEFRLLPVFWPWVPNSCCSILLRCSARPCPPAVSQSNGITAIHPSCHPQRNSTLQTFHKITPYKQFKMRPCSNFPSLIGGNPRPRSRSEPKSNLSELF